MLFRLSGMCNYVRIMIGQEAVHDPVMRTSTWLLAIDTQWIFIVAEKKKTYYINIIDVEPV